ncbi:MAG: Rrf2 family transcriptional regulator, partial [Paracoccaceae bacterium]|nr:Rrf2 family transcriptional regulator [Paracoccaceae bacterium]
ASETHLAQVIHLLAHKGFLRTLGRSGGLMLGRAMEDIRVGEVFRAFEACLPLAECFAGEENNCPLVGACRLKCALSNALDAFYASLDRLSLADMVAGNTALAGLLKVA